MITFANLSSRWPGFLSGVEIGPAIRVETELHIFTNTILYLDLLFVSLILPMTFIFGFNYKASKKLNSNQQSVTKDARKASLEHRRNITASKTLRVLTILATVTAFLPRLLATVIHVVQGHGYFGHFWSLHMLEISYDVLFVNNIV